MINIETIKLVLFLNKVTNVHAHIESARNDKTETTWAY